MKKRSKVRASERPQYEKRGSKNPWKPLAHITGGLVVVGDKPSPVTNLTVTLCFGADWRPAWIVDKRGLVANLWMDVNRHEKAPTQPSIALIMPGATGKQMDRVEELGIEVLFVGITRDHRSRPS